MDPTCYAPLLPEHGPGIYVPTIRTYTQERVLVVLAQRSLACFKHLDIEFLSLFIPPLLM